MTKFDTNFESEADQLAAINEGLADTALAILSRAIKGDPRELTVEKDLQRARRAIAKAEAILRGITANRSD